MKKLFYIFVLVFCLISLDAQAKTCKLGRNCNETGSRGGDSSRASAGCKSDADCEGSVCNLTTHRCVSKCDPKVFTQSCSGDTPTCVIVDGTAKCGCTEDSQCKGTYKHCSSQHQCVECVADDQCPSNEKCSSISNKCEPIVCEVENCSECVIGDGTACQTCAEGFKLEDGQCLHCDVSNMEGLLDHGVCNSCTYYSGDAICTSGTCDEGYEFNSSTGRCEKQECVGNEVYIEGVGCTEDYCQGLTGICVQGQTSTYYWTNNTSKKACCCEK
ncbi:MAG: hypothetical protein MJ247_05940 [Alphaproteobacteria bacterium]|nr:hypothetical protein [Alphaproteobacteria bacterium]